MTAEEQKEEIIRAVNFGRQSDAKIMIDEYAKQQAIKFGERLGKEELTYAIETSEWHNGYIGKSTKELYEECLKEQEEK